MTRTLMISFMGDNPNVKMTHPLFSPEEYIYQKEDGKVYTEEGYLFEDWYSDERNGIRMRAGGSWEDGWTVKLDNETCKLLSMTESGKAYLYNNVCETCQYFVSTCSYLQK